MNDNKMTGVQLTIGVAITLVGWALGIPFPVTFFATVIFCVVFDPLGLGPRFTRCLRCDYRAVFHH